MSFWFPWRWRTYYDGPATYCPAKDCVFADTNGLTFVCPKCGTITEHCAVRIGTRWFGLSKRILEIVPPRRRHDW